MTNEEKLILLKDLCARLPYGVIVRHSDCIVDDEGNETGKFYHTKGYLCDVCTEDDMTTTIIESEGEDEGYNHICSLEFTVPYLRPISLMTEEEKRDLSERYKFYYDKCSEGIVNGTYFAQFNRTVYQMVYENDIEDITEWLDSHHFAWRTLNGNDMFELGLAIEAPEGMYNIKNKSYDENYRESSYPRWIQTIQPKP